MNSQESYKITYLFFLTDRSKRTLLSSLALEFSKHFLSTNYVLGPKGAKKKQTSSCPEGVACLLEGDNAEVQ